MICFSANLTSAEGVQGVDKSSVFRDKRFGEYRAAVPQPGGEDDEEVCSGAAGRGDVEGRLLSPCPEVRVRRPVPLLSYAFCG